MMQQSLACQAVPTESDAIKRVRRSKREPNASAAHTSLETVGSSTASCLYMLATTAGSLVASTRQEDSLKG
jgi:hypothetical protein